MVARSQLQSSSCTQHTDGGRSTCVCMHVLPRTAVSALLPCPYNVSDRQYLYCISRSGFAMHDQHQHLISSDQMSCRR